jgi:hypothetical protein
MLRDRDRRRLATLRAQIREATVRRREALQRARKLCRVAKQRVKVQVRELRAAERQRITRLVAELKANERAACRARKARVVTAGGSVEAKRRAVLLEEQRTQRAIRGAELRAAKQVKSSAKERRQESDDRVSNNLPVELRALWERFKGDFRATKRATRTEAFLEWSQANPDEVLRMQSDQADRDVERLTRERTRLERKLSKKRSYDVCPTDLATLTAMGLATDQASARRKVPALSMPPPF